MVGAWFLSFSDHFPLPSPPFLPALPILLPPSLPILGAIRFEVDLVEGALEIRVSLGTCCGFCDPNGNFENKIERHLTRDDSGSLRVGWNIRLHAP